MKIAIISHTEHYKNNEGIIVGWGATVKEIDKLLEVVDSITHIAPLHKSNTPESVIAYTSGKIRFIPLKPSGGKGFEKISILKNLFYNIKQIKKGIKDVDYIQFRAPTGIGIYVLPFLKFFSRKKYWVKYAGNWKDKHMPLGNRLQKWWIKKILSLNIKVTVNGKWENEKTNIIPFENPCLDKDDRSLGKLVVAAKNVNKKVNLCFVGALNKHKGVHLIIEALKNIDSDRIGEMHFVGDGNEKKLYLKEVKQLKYKTTFHGFLQKDRVSEIYEKSHFILLPSKSEGFPKVIGEAMNYGCIPIVSDVSCINQYVEDGINGFLLRNPLSISLEKKIFEAMKLSNIDFINFIQYNYQLADKFTYTHYNLRIKNEILN
ncbi:MAG: glycosyltransferase family 4 protein [Flavobacteriaceae bacterium]|nr:glycosyltransferase family 4 protein [Flavobacteriaceae bacterium]